MVGKPCRPSTVNCGSGGSPPSSLPSMGFSRHHPGAGACVRRRSSWRAFSRSSSSPPTSTSSFRTRPTRSPQLVQVAGGHDRAGAGGIYFVDVIVRKATLLEQLFGGLHDGADLYPADEVVPARGLDRAGEPGERRRDATSQQVAAAVALRAFGKKVGVVENGAIVSQIEPGFPADGKLTPTDRIVAINGKTVQLTDRHLPRDVWASRSARTSASRFSAAATALVPLTTVAAATGSKRGVVGVLLDPSEKIKPARQGLDRRTRRRRPVGRSRVRARRPPAARAQRRPRPQGRRDGRDLPQRRRRPDRRDQAKNDRRARGGCGCLPRSDGECGRGPQVRTRPAHRACEEFSTGVARPGNIAASPLETWEFRSFERRGNCAFSLQASPCRRAAHA